MRRRISIRGPVRPSVRMSVPCYFRSWKVRILGASCAVYPALLERNMPLRDASCHPPGPVKAMECWTKSSSITNDLACRYTRLLQSWTRKSEAWLWTGNWSTRTRIWPLPRSSRIPPPRKTSASSSLTKSVFNHYWESVWKGSYYSWAPQYWKSRDQQISSFIRGFFLLLI